MLVGVVVVSYWFFFGGLNGEGVLLREEFIFDVSDYGGFFGVVGCLFLEGFSDYIGMECVWCSVLCIELSVELE